MNQNSVLKIQYSKGEERIISLYWINYAIEGYIEAKLHEFTNDWDLNVTLGNISKKTA